MEQEVGYTVLPLKQSVTANQVPSYMWNRGKVNYRNETLTSLENKKFLSFTFT